MLGTAEIRSLYHGYGVEPAADTPEEFGAYLRRELAKWKKVVQSAGLDRNPQ